MTADEPLPLFGPDHAGALLFTVVAAVGATVVLRSAARFGPAAAIRAGVCRALAVLLILNEIVNHARQALDGVWTVQKSLPLHLCGLGIYVAAAALWLAARREQAGGAAEASLRSRTGLAREPPPGPSRGQAAAADQVLYELTYFWGLGGSVQALLTPEIPDRFPSIAFLTFFFGHAAMVVSALALTLGLGRRPRADSVRRVWWITLGAAAVVFVINAATGANYMYLRGRPDRPSLYDYFGPWPWALLTLVGVATVVFWLLYLPFWFVDRSRLRRAARRRYTCGHGSV
jgi:uncharacterized membrane protein YwaF